MTYIVTGGAKLYSLTHLAAFGQDRRKKKTNNTGYAQLLRLWGEHENHQPLNVIWHELS